MSHRVHPKIYRIRGIEDWNSRGFYGKKMAQYLEEDFLIKKFLWKKLAEASVDNIEIERSENKLNIIIKTSRPGLVIGRGGEGIEKLKKMIEKEVLQKKNSIPRIAFQAIQDITPKEIKLEIREVKNPWFSASITAQWMAQQIEKRVRYRRVLKRALDKIITNKEVKGARVEVAGRLNGVEISRTEWLKSGQLPRQTLRADIDYALVQAYCTYGVIGVKVWIYKGEKFD